MNRFLFQHMNGILLFLRDIWRQWVRALRNGVSASTENCVPTTTHQYNTRNKVDTIPPDNQTVIIPTTTTELRKRSAMPKYPACDTHEMFFRPTDGRKWRRQRSKLPQKRKKWKKSDLTDKQRAQFARDHYTLYHGPSAPSITDDNNPSPPPPTPTTPIDWTPSPKILGHHRNDKDINFDITVAPIDFLDLFYDYSPEIDRQVLRDLNNLCL